MAIADKRRPQPNEAEVLNIIGSVKNKNILIIDDIVDTAGTMIQAAEAAIQEGASGAYAGCTHPILSGNAIGKLKKSKFSEIVVTDTVPLAKDKKIDKIKVLSVANLFGSAIKRIYNEESISILFD